MKFNIKALLIATFFMFGVQGIAIGMQGIQYMRSHWPTLMPNNSTTTLNGKRLYFGHIKLDQIKYPAVVRTNADGNVDTLFGDEGIVIFMNIPNADARIARTQPDGSIQITIYRNSENLGIYQVDSDGRIG